MNLRDSVRLNHILDSLKDLMVIFNEVSNVEQFLTHRLYKHASVRHLEIIGEACGSLSEEFKNMQSLIDWQSWKDLRNILIHQYFGVDYKRIYLVIQDEVPILLDKVQKILEEDVTQ